MVLQILKTQTELAKNHFKIRTPQLKSAADKNTPMLAL